MKTWQSILLMLALFGLINNVPADVVSYSLTTEKLHIPSVEVQGFDTFEVRLNLLNKNPMKFVLQEVISAPTATHSLAIFSFDTGTLHIPFVEVSGVSDGVVQHYYVDMALVQETEPLQFVLTKAVLAKTIAAFEVLATKPHSLTDIPSKVAELDAIITAIATEIEADENMFVAVGTKEIGTLGTTSAFIPYPPVDYNMDGSPDDAGHMLEVSFDDDSEFLRVGLRHGIALPWQIAAYTYGDTIYVIAGVPQTVVRTYFRGVDNFDQLMSLSTQYQSKIETVVASALEPLGFTTHINTAIENTQLGEFEIAAIETAFGQELTPDFIAPSITITSDSVDMDTVITAIENAFLADEVPDLDGNGKAGEQGDDAVLPNAIMDYIAGNMTFEQFSAMLKQGMEIWGNGGAFQDWQFLREIEFSDDQAGTYHLMELCQPFYSGVALGFGLYHMPSMPCALGVWEDSEGVHVNLLAPQFIFGYFFADATETLEPTSPMMQIFSVFPTMVYNELVGIINSALRDIGVEEQLEFR
jgi:hypothetical protein